MGLSILDMLYVSVRSFFHCYKPAMHPNLEEAPILRNSSLLAARPIGRSDLKLRSDWWIYYPKWTHSTVILLMEEIRLTTWQVVYPIIYRVSYIPGGARFQPAATNSQPVTAVSWSGHVFQVMTSGCMPLESWWSHHPFGGKFMAKTPGKTGVFLQHTPPYHYKIN